MQDGTLWYKKSKKSQISTNSVICLNSLLSGSQVAFYKGMVFYQKRKLTAFSKVVDKVYRHSGSYIGLHQ